MKKLEHIQKNGNIIELVFYDENNECYREVIAIEYPKYTVKEYDEFGTGGYNYINERSVERGSFPIFVIYHEDVYYNELEVLAKRDTTKVFYGEEYDEVMEKVKPYLAKEREYDHSLKIIDFEVHGSQLVLYLGKPETKEYWGDDWDDTPYEHNAGTVYERFVEDIITLNLDIEDYVKEPASFTINSRFCKEDFQRGEYPFAVIITEPEYSFNNFHDMIHQPNAIVLYFNDPVSKIDGIGFVSDGRYEGFKERE